MTRRQSPKRCSSYVRAKRLACRTRSGPYLGTLLRDNAASAVLGQASREVGIDPSGWQQAEAETVAAGKSFLPFSYLSSLYPEPVLDALKQHFLALATQTNLLYDDALPLLAALSERHVPAMILTYGENDFQRLKLEATGLHTYEYIISDIPHKGGLIAGWRRAENYLPPGRPDSSQALRVLLVDDKAIAFAGLPDDCRGAWLQRPDEPMLPSQLGEVSSTVAIIANLAD